MDSFKKVIGRVMLLLACAILFVGVANAQNPSAPAQLTLTYTVPESIVVTVNPSTLALSTTATSTMATITYQLSTSRTRLNVLAYVNNPALVGTNPSNTIPAADVIDSAGNAPTPCTNTGFGAFSGTNVCDGNYWNVPSDIPYSGTKTQVFYFSLSTTNFPVDSYTGNAYIVAIAQ